MFAPMQFAEVFGVVQELEADRYGDLVDDFDAAFARFTSEPPVRIMFESGAGTDTLVGLFEKSAYSKTKCMSDAMKCCATNPTTCKIEKQEIIDSPIGGVLAPDVEVFDAAGKWKPVAKGKNPNGMSVGLGFTGVKAAF